MYSKKLLLKKMYVVYNLTLIKHMAINIDWEIFAAKIFSSVHKAMKIKCTKILHAQSCATFEWQNTFNAKISNKLFLPQKNFLIYSRVISNKHYHGNMSIFTKLVESNFNLFSLQLLQNNLQMPTKWTLKASTSRRSINNWKL